MPPVPSVLRRGVKKLVKLQTSPVSVSIPRKLLSTGEGGAILTDREDWDEILSVKLNHGATVENGKYNFIDCGYNYRLSELQAVMGLVQIRKLDSIIASRTAMREEFRSRLEPAGYRAQRVYPDVVYNVQSLVFIVPEGMDRDGLSDYLRDHGVESTIGTYCLSGCTYFKERYNDVQPVAEGLQKNTITFPCP